ncbi:hypothetical protein N7539_008761 [Penicillium diatomitis]|uniref:Transposase n=1 Tax=Penicillium diatomitis TaxID=2819901 RepID=A0A9X0BLW1_9EURO|nr:uncharacterized protein N7539_008761 [Penicillium diatomitis]KAJ5471818.1 hypothetical protein N7539_008761 [Penicillium diatomitis]
MAEEAECSQATIINIRANLRQFGSVHAPPTRIGRRRTVTPLMIEALCEHLSEKPGLYLDEMAVFLWDEFRTLVTTSSIRRALVAKSWSKKSTRQQARERNADLREWYLYNLSDFQSYQLVYVDESGCDKRVGFRRTGWSPLGFDAFLGWCIDVVGAKEESARGHFRHAGLKIEEALKDC